MQIVPDLLHKIVKCILDRIKGIEGLHMRKQFVLLCRKFAAAVRQIPHVAASNHYFFDAEQVVKLSK